MIPLSRIMRICLGESAAFLAGKGQAQKEEGGPEPAFEPDQKPSGY
jgi:hypothetical protein